MDIPAETTGIRIALIRRFIVQIQSSNLSTSKATQPLCPSLH